MGPFPRLVFISIVTCSIRDSYPLIKTFTFVYYIVATNGIVLATEKKQKSILYDDTSIHKIEMITKHSGMVYSGMGPDYRYA